MCIACMSIWGNKHTFKICNVLLLSHSKSFCTNAPLRNVPSSACTAAKFCSFLCNQLYNTQIFLVSVPRGEQHYISHGKPTSVETSNHISNAQISGKRDYMAFKLQTLNRNKHTDYCLLGCDIMYSRRYISLFRESLVLPFSEYKRGDWRSRFLLNARIYLPDLMATHTIR
jgi:hypothetical protein